jgi:hypothetical protein
MTVRTLPDTVRALSEFLRADDDVAALVGDRVYSALPTNPTFPCVRLSRLGGQVRSQPAYHLESTLIQVEALGGSRHSSWLLAETCRAVIAQLLNGTVDVGPDTAVISHSEVGGIREDTVRTLPKNDDGTERHRAHFDAVIYAHPSPQAGS